MDCKTCKEMQYVPQVTHDADMAILERNNRRLFIFLAIAVAALVASWIFFFWHRDQYMCNVTEVHYNLGGGERDAGKHLDQD